MVSKIGHISGATSLKLNVRLSTRSYALSNRSAAQVYSRHVDSKVTRIAPKAFVSSVNLMMGMITCWISCRILGEESTDETI